MEGTMTSLSDIIYRSLKWLITAGCICSFLFENLKNYSYLCKKITYTPCYKIVKIMKITKLFNGSLHNCLSENGKKEVDKQHTEWMKEVFSFLFFGLILGIIIGVLL